MAYVSPSALLDDVLAINGWIAGCGKTILCSTIIDELYTLSQASPGKALAYFYFDFNDSARRTVEFLIRCVISQLSAQQVDTNPALETLFGRNEEGACQPPLNDLFAVLLPLAQCFDRTYLVIDGLDECTECEDLLQILEQIHGWRYVQLHIIVTSRQLSGIEDALAGLISDDLCVHESAINEDITLYLTKRLQNDRKLTKWPAQLREAIWNTLSSRACGMFRWVTYQLDTLKTCHTVDVIKRKLETLPRTLEETYDQILLGIDESYRHSALKVLQWLAFSARPVTIEEVAEVLAINWNNEPHYDMDFKLFKPQDVMLLCSNLITTATGSIYDAPELPSTYNEYDIDKYDNFDVIRLAHLSVKDYLVSDRIRSTSASFFATDARLANSFLAQTCFVYLLHPAFASGHCGWDVLQARFKD